MWWRASVVLTRVQSEQVFRSYKSTHPISTQITWQHLAQRILIFTLCNGELIESCPNFQQMGTKQVPMNTSYLVILQTTFKTHAERKGEVSGLKKQKKSLCSMRARDEAAALLHSPVPLGFIYPTDSWLCFSLSRNWASPNLKPRANCGTRLCW